MAPIDFTNVQKTIRIIIWGYIYTLKIKMHIKNDTWNFIIFTTTLETFVKLSGQRVLFIRKRMYSSVNNENY